jgi:glycosyltransferase involved in cell wall biosynthesis
MILRSLFDGFPQDRLWVFTGKNCYEAARKVGRLLPCTHYLVSLPAGRRIMGRVKKLASIALIPAIVRRAVEIIRRHDVQIIFTSPKYGEFFVAAYVAHKITRKPLYVYIMDDWEAHVRLGHPTHRILTALCGTGRVLRRASQRWVISKYMGEAYKREHGVECHTLPFAVDIRREPPVLPRPFERSRILYAGSIYKAQADPIRNLVRALREFPLGAGPELYIYSRMTQNDLERLGIADPRVHLDCVRADQIGEVIRGSDLLFLPLTFDEAWRKVVSTSLPTKVPEYLVSSIPVLVHAPTYATVSRYASEFEWGLVVDQPDTQRLKREIARLLGDYQLREKFVSNAHDTAARFHDARLEHDCFHSAFMETSVQ